MVSGSILYFFGSHFSRLGGILQGIYLIIGFVNSSINFFDIDSVPFAEVFLSKLYSFALRLLVREFNNSLLLWKIMCTVNFNSCLIPQLLELSGSFGGQTQPGPRSCVQYDIKKAHCVHQPHISRSLPLEFSPQNSP